MITATRPRRTTILMVMLSFAAASYAQTFPAKPVRIVVPSPAGGPSDFAARAVSQNLPQYLGQSVIVDNRPGGAGLIGAEIVAKAPPDGHTLLVATGGLMIITPLVINKMPYQ